MSPHVETRAPEGLSVRFPDPAGHPVEALVDEANHRARADSIDLLDGLVPGLSFASLSQRADGGTLTVARGVDALVARLDPSALLERLLLDQDVGPPRLKLARYGHVPDASSVTERLRPREVPTCRAVAARLALALDAGTTFVLDGIDLKDPALARLSEHVERVHRTSVNINGYVSLRPHQSFGPHWDDHEVLIIHLLGRKHWDLRAPVVLSPHRSLHEADAHGDPVWEGTVDPGTVLSIPRGWGHDATGRDELSFHLTITIPRTGVLDVVSSGLRQLRRDPDAYALVGAAVGDEAPDAGVVRELVGRAGRGDRRDLTLATQASNVRSRHDQTLTSLLDACEGRTTDEQLWIRAPHPGGVMVGHDEHDPVGHILVFGRTAVRATTPALQLLGPRLDGRAHRVADLAGGSGAPSARAVVVDALRAGLVGVARPPGRTDPVLDP